MKTAIYRLLAVAAVLATLWGCASIKHESAMEWMQNQPMLIDP